MNILLSLRDLVLGAASTALLLLGMQNAARLLDPVSRKMDQGSSQEVGRVSAWPCIEAGTGNVS
jgi:hypothetical protein